MLIFNKIKLIGRNCLLIISCLVLCVSANATTLSTPNIVVIGNIHINAQQLSKKQLAAIYLDKQVDTGIFSSAEHLVPFDQPAQSKAYQTFYRNVLGWDSKKVNNYWTFAKLTSSKQAPNAVSNDQEAIAAVAHHAKAVAYVDESALRRNSSGVKVLYRVNGKATSSTAQPIKLSSAQRQTQTSAHTQVTQSSASSLPKPLDTNAEVRAEGVASVWSLLSANMQLSHYDNQPAVQKWLKWYLRNPKTLQTLLNNSAPYLDYVYRQTRQNNMPAEFALLPMVESAYEPAAFSRTGAVGLWQMMPGTAMIYGLDINWWYDGRRDVQSSTKRALNYLVNLHKSTGSWLLAAAGYNAGGGRIQREVKANQHAGLPSDFWHLNLPKETRDYVPKLLALAEIVKNAKRYGIDLPNIPATPYFKSIQLNSQFDIAEIARLAETSIGEIKRLNPGMTRFATDPGNPYTVLIPTNKVAVFQANLARVIGKSHVTWQYHEVHRGQTLASIAKNYRTNTALLMKVNNLSSDYVPINQGILVPLYLHRTYKNAGKSDAVTANNTLSKNGVADDGLKAAASLASADQADSVPVSSANITTEDILSGKTLDIASSATNATGNSQATVSKQAVTDNASASVQQVASEQSVTQLKAPQVKQLGISNSPISKQDNLQTIMLKLYGQE